jgi:hypothetical protein
MEEELKYIAYLKYDGKLVENGLLDTRKSAEALLGLDESIRFFLSNEYPELKTVDFEIPVRIQKGSWEALIPENIDQYLIKGIIAWSAAKYFGSALSEMAKNDFKNVSFSNLFKEIFKGISWLLKIALHRGSMRKRKIENLKFENNNELIGVPNDKQQYIYIPRKYFELFLHCPETLFTKITNVIELDREMEIGIPGDEESKVRLNYSQKPVFSIDKEDDEIIFPELAHNDYVELEGYVTRGNESANSIGFLYKGHILNCHPQKGSVVKYKDEMFTNCFIKGNIDRKDKFGEIIEKKPRIIFTDLVLNKTDNNKPENLFG